VDELILWPSIVRMVKNTGLPSYKPVQQAKTLTRLDRMRKSMSDLRHLWGYS
jgi:hypothetical protein